MATCWLVDRRQSKHGKPLRLQAQRPVSIKDAKGRSTQPDQWAPPCPTLRVAHIGCQAELNAALRKTTSNKAGVADLPQNSGNGSQTKDN